MNKYVYGCKTANATSVTNGLCLVIQLSKF